MIKINQVQTVEVELPTPDRIILKWYNEDNPITPPNSKEVVIEGVTYKVVNVEIFRQVLPPHYDIQWELEII